MQTACALWRWIVRECQDQLRRLEWISDRHGRFGAGLVPAVSLAGPLGAAIGSSCWWAGLLVAAVVWPTVWWMFREIDLADLEPDTRTARTDLDQVDLPN